MVKNIMIFLLISLFSMTVTVFGDGFNSSSGSVYDPIKQKNSEISIKSSNLNKNYIKENPSYEFNFGAKVCLDPRDPNYGHPCPHNSKRSIKHKGKKRKTHQTSNENSGVWSLPTTGHVCIDMNTHREYDCNPEEELKKKKTSTKWSLPPGCSIERVENGIPVFKCKKVDSNPKKSSNDTKTGDKSTPPTTVDYQKILILLTFPSTRHLKHSTKRVFGSAFANFRKAQITGMVRWQIEGLSGLATGVPVIAYVMSNYRDIHKAQTHTDKKGRFSITVPVNPHGLRGIRRFYVNVTRSFRDYVQLPKKLKKLLKRENKRGKTSSRTEDSWEKGIKNWRPKLHTNSKYLKISNFITKEIAIIKDKLHRITGGKGSPNLDQWKKNHQEGRDYANALNLITESAKYGLGKTFDGIDKSMDWMDKAQKAKDAFSSKKNKKRKESLGVRVARLIHIWFARLEQAIEAE
jgi:hypothetical protein